MIRLLHIHRRRELTWIHLLAAAALAALGVFAARNAWMDILTIGRRDPEMSHIFLVPLFALWLIWIRRHRWRQCRVSGVLIGPILVALGWALYTMGDRFLIESAWHLGAIVIVIGCILSVLGGEFAVRFFPAFLILLFLVPVPGRIRESLALPLETAAAAITQQILDLLGAQAERAGNLLTINGVQVDVAEACNGLRMVFALTLVAFAFSFGTPLRQSVRFIVIIASPLLALVTNVIRLVTTVWVYGNYPSAMADRYHDITGWAMLPLGFGLLLGIVQLLRWAMIPVTPFMLAED